MPLNSDIWREARALGGPVDFADWFAALPQWPLPVEIEIGCGKGLFLATSAEQRPDTAFVGVERDGTYLKLARQKVEKAELANVCLVHGDMTYFLLHCVPDGSVSAYHVFFPDPWPKRRHQRRRMFSDIGVEQLARTLVAGGRLIVKTDLPVNFSRIRRVVNDSQLFDLEEQRVWRSAADAPAGNIPTNFEIKYTQNAKEIFYARWRVKR